MIAAGILVLGIVATVIIVRWQARRANIKQQKRGQAAAAEKADRERAALEQAERDRVAAAETAKVNRERAAGEQATRDRATVERIAAQFRAIQAVKPKTGTKASPAEQQHEELVNSTLDLLRQLGTLSPALSAAMIQWLVQRYTEVHSDYAPQYLWGILSLLPHGVAGLDVQAEILIGIDQQFDALSRPNIPEDQREERTARLIALEDQVRPRPAAVPASSAVTETSLPRNPWIDQLMQPQNKPVQANGEMAGDIKILAAWLRGQKLRDPGQVRDVIRWFMQNYMRDGHSAYLGALEWILETGVDGLDAYAELEIYLNAMSFDQYKAKSDRVGALKALLANKPKPVVAEAVPAVSETVAEPEAAPVLTETPAAPRDQRIVKLMTTPLKGSNDTVARHQEVVDEIMAWLRGPGPRNAGQAAQAVRWLGKKYLDVHSTYAGIYFGALEGLVRDGVAAIDVRAVLSQLRDQRLQEALAAPPTQAAPVPAVANTSLGDQLAGWLGQRKEQNAPDLKSVQAQRNKVFEEARLKRLTALDDLLHGQVAHAETEVIAAVSVPIPVQPQTAVVSRDSAIDNLLNNPIVGKKLPTQHRQAVDRVVKWLQANPAANPRNPDQVREAILWLAGRYLAGDYASVYLEGIAALVQSGVPELNAAAEWDAFVERQLAGSPTEVQLGRLEALLDVLSGKLPAAKPVVEKVPEQSPVVAQPAPKPAPAPTEAELKRQAADRRVKANDAFYERARAIQQKLKNNPGLELTLLRDAVGLLQEGDLSAPWAQSLMQDIANKLMGLKQVDISIIRELAGIAQKDPESALAREIVRAVERAQPAKHLVMNDLLEIVIRNPQSFLARPIARAFVMRLSDSKDRDAQQALRRLAGLNFQAVADAFEQVSQQQAGRALPKAANALRQEIDQKRASDLKKQNARVTSAVPVAPIEAGRYENDETGVELRVGNVEPDTDRRWVQIGQRVGALGANLIWSTAKFVSEDDIRRLMNGEIAWDQLPVSPGRATATVEAIAQEPAPVTPPVVVSAPAAKPGPLASVTAHHGYWLDQLAHSPGIFIRDRGAQLLRAFGVKNDSTDYQAQASAAKVLMERAAAAMLPDVETTVTIVHQGAPGTMRLTWGEKPKAGGAAQKTLVMAVTPGVHPAQTAEGVVEEMIHFSIREPLLPVYAHYEGCLSWMPWGKALADWYVLHFIEERVAIRGMQEFLAGHRDRVVSTIGQVVKAMNGVADLTPEAASRASGPIGELIQMISTFSDRALRTELERRRKSLILNTQA